MENLTLLGRTPGKPFVSIFIPTRTRPDSRLEQTISNCIHAASKPEDLEFLIKVDHDDEQALNLSQSIAKKYNSRFFIHVTQRGNGYSDIPRYMNELAERATGDWLWLLGDNAWPTSQDWDLAIEQWFPPLATYLGCQDVCLFSPMLTMEEGFKIPISPTPFVRRKLYEVLGHLTMLPCWDMWLNSVAFMSGILMTVPVTMEHVPASSRTDLDEEVIQRINGKRFSIETRRAMVEDAKKIVDYLENYEKKAHWSSLPEQQGLHFWRSPLGFLLLVLVDNEGKVWISEEQVRHFISGGSWCWVDSHGELLS